MKEIRDTRGHIGQLMQKDEIVICEPVPIKKIKYNSDEIVSMILTIAFTIIVSSLLIYNWI